ncbi:structure-specific endonuclease subunit slx1 [Neodiprion virginianus]|uniref:structure-specific endonuclease subunit slx1 n=1 Tax=Neodiprion virginianus TaxID=2961670 RepID=UPI001EE77289|nr:structure-specific endonuclease subunit slx1 [Neodiprion virginianus]
MENPDVVEHFYGVYLLYCTNPKYKGRIYIGYTVDPNRRIKQHNAGKQFGGAWRTSNKGPWTMVMIIHGFPNDISALRFEWAWQHPDISRRLKHVPRKKSGQNSFDYHLMVLGEMLRAGPWSRLPLTVRWLAPHFAKDFPAERCPPMHMPLVYGKVIPKKVQQGEGGTKNRNKDAIPEDTDASGSAGGLLCSLCKNLLEPNEKLTCVNPTCTLVSHLVCLAKRFRNDGMILPVEGTCPACRINILWGDLIRKMKGCYQDLAEAANAESDSDISDF